MHEKKADDGADADADVFFFLFSQVRMSPISSQQSQPAAVAVGSLLTILFTSEIEHT